jgi:hypothetical protein
MKYKYLISYSNIIFVSFCSLLFIIGRSKLFRDPGTFLHTVIGDQIFSSGLLPTVDTFSFTRHGSPWIAQQWLGEIIMAFIHGIAGLDGLLILAVSLIALLYSILAARIERSGMNLMLGAFILIFSLATASHHFLIRPHLATLFLIAVVYGRLIDFDQKRVSYAQLYWLIPIVTLWANLHGGVLGGLFTIGLAVLGWTVAFFTNKYHHLNSYGHIIGLWTLTVLCFIAVLINPYGYDLPLTWLRIMASPVTANLIEEHASFWTLLRIGKIDTYITFLLMLILGAFHLFLLSGTHKNDRKITWYIPIVWFLLSLSRIRHAPLFSVLSVIAIADIYPHCRWIKALGDMGLVTFKIKSTSDKFPVSTHIRFVLPIIVFTVGLLLFHGSSTLPSTSQQWVKLDPAYWPTELLPDLKRLEVKSPEGTPIFNDMLFGGFLVYYTPKFRVFIDDRCELYGDEFMIKYIKAERKDFRAWTNKYHFNIALVQHDSNYRLYFGEDPVWCLAKESSAGALYERCHDR